MTVLPIHLDPAIPLDVPEDVRARLRKNGNAQKTRARKKNETIRKINANIADPKMHISEIRIQDFDVTECYDRDNWTCFVCFRRVDITKPSTDPEGCVCGHKQAMGQDGHHEPDNVGPCHQKCNAQIAAGIEVPAMAKAKRLRAKHSGIGKDGKPVQKKKSNLRGRGFQKPKGGYKWASRPLKSRNTFKDR